MKDQILMIGGGMTFENKQKSLDYYKNFDIFEQWKTKSWKDWLAWSLEDKYDFLDFKKIARENADYDIWKIVFEKYFIKFNSEKLIIISHSLGTIFILKYLVENGFVKKIKQLHLVSPIVSNDFQPANDPENTGTFTFDISKLSEIKEYCDEIHIWHSTDDAVCLFKNAEHIKQEISESQLHIFHDKEHFNQSTFWELFDLLRNN